MDNVGKTKIGDGRDIYYNNCNYMEDLYLTKIVKVGNSLAVVVPKNVLHGLDWKRGDRVVFTFGYDDTLIVKKVDDETIRRLKEQGGLDRESVIDIT